MNKPQLSAEMEKRLEKFLTDIWGWSYEYGEWLDSESQPIGGIKDLKHFLATALEEARQKVLSEVYDLMNESDGVAGLHLNGEVATWDWLLDHGWLPTVTKLNQLKGTEWVGVFAPNGGHDPNNPYPLKRKE